MSEYQYYEFRAIDRPLTEQQRRRVSALSSRAQVTSHMASFVYHYSDFRGDPDELMERYFDAMIYMANWGSRRLMLRIPRAAAEFEQIEAYCLPDYIALKPDKDFIVVDLYFHDEDLMGWTEGEGWLDELLPLREELLHNDFRFLYLAWLKGAEWAMHMEDMDEDTLEPPVPPGLNNLSSALEVFVDFLGIDNSLIQVAARESQQKPKPDLQLEQWVDKLSREEQLDFLTRLSRGESHLSAQLNRRLRGLARQSTPRKKQRKVRRRTIGELVQVAEEWEQEQVRREQEEAERARRQYLESLADREDQVWEEVASLIEETKVKAYDRAIELLKDLRDLAEYQDELELFEEKISAIADTYSRRSALMRKMREAELI